MSEPPRIDRALTLTPTTEDVVAMVREFLPSFREPAEPKVSVIKGGITNQLFKCSCGHEDVMIRIYGERTEEIISRPAELYWMSKAMPVHGLFADGLVYHFVKGSPLPEEAPPYSPSPPGSQVEGIAKAMAKFHSAMAPHAAASPVQDAFLDTVARSWIPHACTLAKQTSTGLSADAKGLVDTLPGLAEQSLAFLEHLQGAMDKLGLPMCISHNDLLPGNIITPPAGAAEPELKFIDFEYTQSNFVIADIANHFIEWTGQYACKDGVYKHNDWAKYPTTEQQEAFIRHYFNAMQQHNPSDPLWKDFPMAKALAAGKLLALASLLQWGWWAISQACTSSIDFDYWGFALSRLGRFRDTKDECWRSSRSCDVEPALSGLL
eukprot:gene2527-3267_t